jgi:hypothetical protein
MQDRSWSIVSTCGRRIGMAEVQHAREVLRLCSGLSRHELALTLCEHWGWTSATGGSQLRSCVKLLEQLEQLGELVLPDKRPQARQRRSPVPSKPIALGAQTAPPKPVVCKLSELQGVRLELVTDRKGIALFNEFVARYHPLGCKRSFGCTLRYFVDSSVGRLGCILMGSAALSIAVRDGWIGWSRQQRLSRLPWVINNQRLLLFPWVTVPHLVSHALGQLARGVQTDWQSRWGYRPVLMETFVDGAHYRGVGYRAAGWQLLGETTGHGICRARREYRTTAKLVFVRPLSHDFRQQLCLADSGTR